MKKKTSISFILLAVLVLLVACFNQAPLPLEYTLNVVVEGLGQVFPSQGSFEQDHLITFTIEPATGWYFNSWQGPARYDLVEMEGRYHLKMNDHKELIARFAQINHQLDIILVGNGLVDERLISTEYPDGALVELWAQPASGWKFYGWSGDAEGSEDIIYLEMDRDKEVLATFVEIDDGSPKYQLEISIYGEGQVKRKPDLAEYKEGTLVSLTALPAPGYRFFGWSGNVQGQDEAIEVTMDRDKLVQASFEKIPEVSYSIDITIKPDDEVGRVLKFPNKESYGEGEVVSLSIEQARCWAFTGWEINGEPRSGFYLQLVMEEDVTVIAYFQPSL